MKKKFKEELKLLYEAPEPKHKQEFLRSFAAPEISTLDFLRIQVSYIRRENWLLGMILFLLAIRGSMEADPSMVWVLSAAVPFLALAASAEFGRSVRFGMQELELSSRFSMKFVTMARMGILGMGNLVFLAGAFFLIWKGWQGAVLDLGISILFPYLLTIFLDLEITRRMHGKESVYLCAGVAALVSLLAIVDGNLPDPMSAQIGRNGWMGILAVLFLLTGKEIRMFIKQTEEYVWN